MTGKGAAAGMFVTFALGIVIGGLSIVHNHKQVGLADSTEVKQRFEIQRRDLDKELVRMDISAVKGLSIRQQEAYVTYVDSAATRYKIPHLLLHAICSIESGYNPTAVHPTIVVKGKTTRAIGLTGIVWEYHANQLMAEGIATAQYELAEENVNLMASAYILHGMMRDIVHDYAVKGKVLADTSVFSEIVRRYYGAYDETYKQKMLLRIKETAGRQWMRRVAQDMLSAFQLTDIVISPAPNITREVSNATSSRKTIERHTLLAGRDSDSSRSVRVYSLARESKTQK